MKRVILLTVIINWLFINALTAQNPFEEFGVDVPVITLSKGKYPEFIPNDTIHRIGSVVIDTRTGKIIELINTDSIEVTYNYRPDVASRWISPDPLAEEYWSWSPYNYTLGNPIKFIDPNGMWVDGYEDGNGNYVWFDDRKEDQFTDKDGTTWSKVTDNKDSWDEAIVIREAVIDFLVQNDYNESSLRQNISLVGDSESDLFNKEVFAETAITGGMVTDKTKWKDNVTNSGGNPAFQTKNDIDGYDVKCYPDKNGEQGPFMTIVTSSLIEHSVDAAEAIMTDNNVNFRNAFMFLKDSKGSIEGMSKTLLRYNEHFYKDYKK